MCTLRIPRGFTLIELLVVIAIIAVLAAILFPVFARAREKARQTTCSSNQRQIAAATQMYVQDHDESLPNSAVFWQSINMDPGVLICPTLGKTTPNGYAANSTILGTPIGQITDPATKPLTFDGLTISQDPLNTNPVPNIATWVTDYDYRHTNAFIVSYVDGHVGMSATLTTGLGYGLLGTFPNRLLPELYFNFEDGNVLPNMTWSAGGSTGTNATWSVVQDTSANKAMQWVITDPRSSGSGTWDLRGSTSYSSTGAGTTSGVYLANRILAVSNSNPATTRPVSFVANWQFRVVSQTINTGTPTLNLGTYCGIWRWYTAGNTLETPQFVPQTYSYASTFTNTPTFSASVANHSWQTVGLTNYPATNDPVMYFTVYPKGANIYGSTRVDFSLVAQGYYRSETINFDNIQIAEIQPG